MTGMYWLRASGGCSTTDPTNDETQDSSPDSWVFIVRMMAHDSYLISTGGEFLLLNAFHLRQQIGNLLEGNNP